MKRLALVIGLAWAAAGPAGAFVLERYGTSANASWYPVRWSPSTDTVRFRPNERTLDLLPNFARDAQIAPVIDAAMQAWSPAPVSLEVGSPTRISSGGADNVNLITFADTPTNRDVTTNAFAVNLRWWTRSGSPTYWRLQETDIVFDPRSKFATNGRAEMIDLQSVLTHELGHALGLSHTPVASATMWTYIFPGETRGRTLDADDIAAVKATYGAVSEPSTGTLTGRVVTPAQAPVLGAHVVATDGAGVVKGSALTERDGSFSIPLLPAGSYTVHAEPIHPLFETGEFSYDYYRGARRDFRTTFLGGGLPESIQVREGEKRALDPIRVETQRPRLDIRYLDASPNGRDYRNINIHGLTVSAGAYTILLVAGQGLNQETRVWASGNDVTFYTENLHAYQLNDGLPVVLVPISVRAGAVLGGRNLYVAREGETAAFTGALRVTRG